MLSLPTVRYRVRQTDTGSFIRRWYVLSTRERERENERKRASVYILFMVLKNFQIKIKGMWNFEDQPPNTDAGSCFLCRLPSSRGEKCVCGSARTLISTRYNFLRKKCERIERLSRVKLVLTNYSPSTSSASSQRREQEQWRRYRLPVDLGRESLHRRPAAAVASGWCR